MKRYEYQSFNCRLSDKELNELGALGWLLVTHTAVAEYGKFGQYYVFVREINDEKP